MNQSRLGARIGTTKPRQLNSRVGLTVPVSRYLAETDYVSLADMLPEIPPPGLAVDVDQFELLNATDYRETA